jgi:hypothetical protein
MGIKKSKNIKPGHDSGAPEKTYLWKKFIVVSILTLIFTYLSVLIIESNLITIT